MKLHFRTLALFVMTLGIAFGVCAQNTQPSATLYENVRVFDGVSEKLTPPTNVLVVGNTIKAISAKSDVYKRQLLALLQKRFLFLIQM